MRKLLNIIFIIFAIIVFQNGCAHYSNEKMMISEKLINAPADIVWDETLKLLPKERISILLANPVDRSIHAKKDITFWSDGDAVNIKIIPFNDNQTILNLEVKSNNQFIGWGHEERLGKILFSKIKANSEDRNK